MANFLTILHQHPLLLTLLTALLGLIVGSFLNVVIYRLPKILEQEWRHQCNEMHDMTPPETASLTLSTPGSTCPQCGHAITPLENIPVISYLALRGRCRDCHAPIGVRYPFIELLTALLSAGVSIHFGYGSQAIFALPLVWALIALTFIDIDTQLLPDRITLPLLWLGLLINLNGIFVPVSQAVIGAAAGYLSLWSVYWAFKLFTGKEGMGFGDFKLLAAIGAWLGWEMLPMVILLSSVVGAITGLIMIAARKQHAAAPMPFGPYLAGGALVALFWGDRISHAWLGALT